MLIKQLLEVYDVLDDSNASGETVEAYLRGIRKDADIHVYPLVGPKGKDSRKQGKDVRGRCAHTGAFGTPGRIGSKAGANRIRV